MYDTVMDKLLTTEEVANLLQIDVQTARRFAREGKIKAIKIGKHFRVRPNDLEGFIKASEVTTFINK